MFLRLVIFASLSLSACAYYSMHSIHLSCNKPDDPSLSLKNMENIANAQIETARGTRFHPFRTKSPYEKVPECDVSFTYRTIDGTCNNLQSAWNGAAKTPLTRLTSNKYQDGISDKRETYFRSSGVLPHARQISRAIHLTRSNVSSQHTHLLMSFGQFLDHDFTLSPESGGEGGEEAEKEQCCEEIDTNGYTGDTKECFPLMVHNDPIFKRKCIPFMRSAPVPALPGQPFMRYQMNDLTSWIDGSQIYGNTKNRSEALRTHNGGLLRSTKGYNGEEGLPHDEENEGNCFAAETMCRFAAGDVRSTEQAGLTSLHVLFLREHNRIAKALHRLNRHWSDEKIYQTGRKIVGAMLQRLSYNEWLPTVLGDNLMNKFRLAVSDEGRFHAYSSNTDASMLSEFSTAAFRFGHSLIRQTFSDSTTHELDLEEMFESFKTTKKSGSTAILKGIVKDGGEVCDRFVSEGLRDNLFNEELDLVALNIQRGRDHGLNSYNQVRRYFKLPIYSSYNSMAGSSHSMTTTNDMKKMYRSTDDLELFVGGLAEEAVSGGVVGETFGHIIAEQFRRLKYGDRYWHETSDKEVGFTDRQLSEIRKTTFAQVFCENVPGVKAYKNLLWLPGPRNPSVRCRSIPRLDLSAWQDRTSTYSTRRPTVEASPFKHLQRQTPQFSVRRNQIQQFQVPHGRVPDRQVLHVQAPHGQVPHVQLPKLSGIDGMENEFKQIGSVAGKLQLDSVNFETDNINKELGAMFGGGNKFMGGPGRKFNPGLVGRRRRVSRRSAPRRIVRTNRYKY